MASNGIKHGRVTYGSRAFHQDASEAMAGDIVRALIETITNSDDAYGANTGKIRIEIDHPRGPWKVVTRDRASGMSAAKMESAIAHLGARTSGFEDGADVRGNLGRGAKDLAAFGTVDFESIHEGKYVKLVLDPDGAYSLFPANNATPQNREVLGIPRGNGTVVSVNVAGSIKCPQHARLLTRLSRHYQLRDIMADPAREVTLADLNRGTTDTIRYSFPQLPIVKQVDLKVEGYPQATASLTIMKNPDRYDDPQSDPIRPAGILIKGRRAIYENTLFRFESNPYAGWFSGRLHCPYIDTLAAEYDSRLQARQPQDPANPQPIITRRRDGLQHSHPFYKALTAAAESALAPLVEQEEKNARERVSTESTRLRRMLDNLARDLSKLVDEDMREIDEEGLGGSTEEGTAVPPLRLVPEEVVMYLSEEKTVSVMAPKDSPSEVTVRSDPEGVVELLDGSSIRLSPHKRRPDLLVGQIHLRPLLEDQTLITATLAQHSAVALVDVRAERDIVEVAPIPADQFQFERSNYRLAWTRKKALRLFAPLPDVATHGTTVYVVSSSEGVVVRGSQVLLTLDEDLEQYTGQVTVEARTLSSQATITATLGEIAASTAVLVTKEEEGPSLTIRIVDEEAGSYRALVEHEANQTVIKVMGQHPVMKRYRGPAPHFPGDDLPTTQLVVAEIVADQIARMILEKKFPSLASGEHLDATRFYVEHYKYLSKYLTRCHRSLVSDTQVDLTHQAQPPGQHNLEPH